MPLPAGIDDFQPRFIFESELSKYGLPSTADAPNIMSLVDAASTFIDQHCAKTDGDGNGSLVYTTYAQRVQMQSPGRNLVRLNFLPLAAISVSTQSDLQSLASASGNNYYTGFLPNEIVTVSGSLSAIIGASGRYSYTRRDRAAMVPDLNYLANPMQLAAFFGGPPQFVPMDASAIDFDTKTGELWIPAGLYYSAYTEIWVCYNSGFDPRHLPKPIKHATAKLVLNQLVRGGGVTGLTSLNASKVSATFTPNLFDDDIKRLLQPYVNAIFY